MSAVRQSFGHRQDAVWSIPGRRSHRGLSATPVVGSTSRIPRAANFAFLPYPDIPIYHRAEGTEKPARHSPVVGPAHAGFPVLRARMRRGMRSCPL